jgi:hypothetical protein
MSNTVTLYKVTVSQSVSIHDQGTSFSLHPWGEDSAEFHGWDDGGRLYELPRGFSVAECNAGGLQIYDERGVWWPLETYRGATPMVAGVMMCRVRTEAELEAEAKAAEKAKLPSKGDYEEYLNELGVPEDDKRSNGGNVLDSARYGSWMRRTDKVAFNVGYQEYCAKVSEQ